MILQGSTPGLIMFAIPDPIDRSDLRFLPRKHGRLWIDTSGANPLKAMFGICSGFDWRETVTGNSMQSDFHKTATTNFTTNRFQNLHFHPSSVTDLISDTLADVNPVLIEREIQLDLDLDPIEARFDRTLIGQAITNLIQNAVHSSPIGGELSLTTIDGSHQWEFEIADSSGSKSDYRRGALDSCNDWESNELPTLIPFPATEFLRSAYRAAFAHGSQLHSWRCPLGGVAYVLTVPRQCVTSIK